MKIRSFVACAAVCLAAQLALGLAEMEINNDRSSANGPFSIPDSITGTCTNDGSPYLSDFFSFPATAGTQYRFYGVVVNGSSFAPLDIGMSIYGAAGPWLVDMDANGDNQNETLDWTAPSSGTYYLEAYEAWGAPNGVASYRVDVSVLSSVDNWDLY
jgi:hypothetical protein